MITTSTINGSTGQTCEVSGIYYCQARQSNTIPLAKGNRFPPCSLNGGHSTTWILKVRA